MNPITIHTGKAELLFFKAPEGTTMFEVDNDDHLLMCWPDHSDMADYIDIPPCKWKLLGDPWGLTEEQCKPLFKNKDGYGLSVELPKPWHRAAYFNAKLALIELMGYLKIYQVNPYLHPIYFGTMGIATYNDMLRKYEEAQERSGAWVVLVKEGGGEMTVTEIVSSWTDSGHRAEMHLIDDNLVFSIAGVDYTIDINTLLRKIDKHRNRKEEEQLKSNK